jgi:hypothetical protein
MPGFLVSAGIAGMSGSGGAALGGLASSGSGSHSAGGDTLVESNWTNGTGTGTTAVGDDGIWAVNQGVAGDQLEVIAATGLDFPAGLSNVLRIRQEGEPDFCDVQITGLPQPGAGADRFYRVYLRWDEAAQSGYDHGMQPIPGTCAIDWALKRNPRTGGVHHFHQFGNAASDEPYFGLIDTGGNDILLSRTATYRYEFHFHFLSTTTFQVGGIRIYNSSNTLLYTAANFYHLDFPGDSAHRLDTMNPTFTVGSTCFQNFMLGNNGQSGWTATETFTYYGAFKIRTADWCGAF